jgi:hypothetical protein
MFAAARSRRAASPARLGIMFPSPTLFKFEARVSRRVYLQRSRPAGAGVLSRLSRYFITVVAVAVFHH